MPERPLLFDTATLSNFALSDSLALLLSRYGRRLLVVSEVLDEIAAGVAAGHTALRAVEEHVQAEKFGQASLNWQERALFGRLLRHLGPGEAACIAAASSRDGIVASDDRAARAVCLERQIPFTGTIGVLKACCLDQQLTAAEADRILAEMIRQGFYSPVNRIRDIL
jgi:predicted nucleic acid-binding protein